MRLNRQTTIAVGILMACARSPHRMIRTVQAAKPAEATKDQAAHIVAILVNEGFLRTTRGRQGGISLALPASEIMLGSGLRRIQPDLVCHTESAKTDATEMAAFTAILSEAEAAFLTFMDRFCIADLTYEMPEVAAPELARMPSAEHTPPYPATSQDLLQMLRGGFCRKSARA